MMIVCLKIEIHHRRLLLCNLKAELMLRCIFIYIYILCIHKYIYLNIHIHPYTSIYWLHVHTFIRQIWHVTCPNLIRNPAVLRRLGGLVPSVATPFASFRRLLSHSTVVLTTVNQESAETVLRNSISVFLHLLAACQTQRQPKNSKKPSMRH